MSSTNHNEQYNDALNSLQWLHARCEHLEMELKRAAEDSDRYLMELDKWRAWAVEHDSDLLNTTDVAMRAWLDREVLEGCTNRPSVKCLHELRPGDRINRDGNVATVTDFESAGGILCVYEDGATELIYTSVLVEVVDG